MNSCYLCEVGLNQENTSIEHIILNSIGGRLKSNSILCKECNSSFGSKADRELSEQLSFVSNYLQVKRDHGKNQDIKGGKTEDGREFRLVDGSRPVNSKPVITKIVSPDGRVEYKVTGEDKEQVLKVLESIKKKSKKKNYNLTHETITETERILDNRDTITFKSDIGGELTFLSITKTAANYFMFVRNEVKHIKHVLPYLKGEVKAHYSVHYRTNIQAYELKDDEVLHVLHLVGDSSKRILYCYVEFFSAYPFISLLSTQYAGESFSSTYCYDVLRNVEVTKAVHVNIDMERLSSSYMLTKEDSKAFDLKLSRVVAIGNKIHVNKEIRKIFNESFDVVIAKYPNEEYVTPEMRNEFLWLVNKRIAELRALSAKKHEDKA